PLEDALWQLTTGEVTGFVVARCAPGRCSGSAAKILTGGLRSLLRYLHVAGFTPIPLAQAVPRAAGWRLSALPRALETEQFARLLESCDRAARSRDPVAAGAVGVAVLRGVRVVSG